MTISEIAQLAGVSKAAVSRYFNNGYVSEEKREAIRKVVEETGYRPSMQAAQLRTKKTKMIGVIAPKMASTTIGRAVEGIQMTLNQEGYQVLLSVTQNDEGKEIEFLNLFNEQGVDGIILFGTIFTPEHKEMLKKLQMPYVIIGQRLPGSFCVFHDDLHAIKDVTAAMIGEGRKNIGYIGVTEDDVSAGLYRYQGYCEALEEAGMEQCKTQRVTAEFNMQSGSNKAEELFAAYPNLDCVVCATDEIAIGALSYLRKKNVDVPAQVKVTGHGDTDVVGIVRASILTVHFAYEESGVLGARMLLEQIKEDNKVPREICLGYYLVENE